MRVGGGARARAAWGPLVVTVLVGGVVADRTSRRAVMVGADLARIATQGTMAVLLISGAGRDLDAGRARRSHGSGNGLFNPASTGLLPEVVPADRLQPANAATCHGRLRERISGRSWRRPRRPRRHGLGDRGRRGDIRHQRRLPPRCCARPRASGARPPRSWPHARRLEGVPVAALGVDVRLLFAIANMLWGAWSSLGPVVADRDLGGARSGGSTSGALGVGALAGSLVANACGRRGRSCSSRHSRRCSRCRSRSWQRGRRHPCWRARHSWRASG